MGSTTAATTTTTAAASTGPLEQYCLRWNDFQSNLTDAFKEIREEGEFLDVVLVADGGRFVKAHKLILSACSPLFKSMLRTSPHPQPMIFLHGVRYADIAAILHFMYQGEVNVAQENLSAFLALAEGLKIRGLSPPGEKPKKRYHNKGPTPGTSKAPRVEDGNTGEGTTEGEEYQVRRQNQPIKYEPKDVVITPDMPPSDFQDNSSSQSDHERSFGNNGAGDYGYQYPRSSSSSSNYRSPHNQHYAGGAVALPEMDKVVMDSIGPCFTLHQLGGRDCGDPLSRMTVAHSPKGWHCPQCLHTSTTKGNLKSHILSGRHKLFEKSYVCQFCSKNYSTRQSLQVHISTHHRRDRDFQLQQQHHQQHEDLSIFSSASNNQLYPGMSRTPPPPSSPSPTASTSRRGGGRLNSETHEEGYNQFHLAQSNFEEPQQHQQQEEPEGGNQMFPSP